jgi:hypothetical protein
MPLSTFNENVFEKIINNLLTTKCEIDPMSVKYSALINLYKYLEKEDIEKLEILKNQLRKKFKNTDDDFVKIMEEKIFDLNNIVLTYEEVKELYKMSNNDFENGNFTVTYNYYNRYYKKEEILNYLYNNYGQEKVDVRRINSEKKSTQMKKMMKERSEKKNNLIEDRKQEVLNILADAELFYPRALYIADHYIVNGGKLNVSAMLNNATEIIKKDRLREKKKEELYEELDKYNCLDMKKNIIFKLYFNGDLTVNLEEVVNFIRELKWLNNEAEYENYLKHSLWIEKYDSLLGKYIKIRDYDKIGKLEQSKDIVKTFVVEKYLKKKNWNLDLIGEVPPYIEKRIREVFDKRDKNEKIMQDLEKEREKKREELRKKEIERREEYKERRREKARFDKETKKKQMVVKDA